MISNAAVVDTNIILSALMSKSSGIREKLFDETMNYVALSIQLQIPLWTGDKKLKQGLMKLGFVDFWEE